MKEYLERPSLVAEYTKTENTKRFSVPVWLSGMYRFEVEASSAEEALNLVRTGKADINYERLQREVVWDFGSIEPWDIDNVEEVSK